MLSFTLVLWFMSTAELDSRRAYCIYELPLPSLSRIPLTLNLGQSLLGDLGIPTEELIVFGAMVDGVAAVVVGGVSGTLLLFQRWKLMHEVQYNSQL
jgi:hypothetical protein